MKLISKIFTALALTVSGCALTSCFGDLDTMPLDDNQLVTEQVYSTVDGYMGVFAKCYASLNLNGQEGDGDPDIQNANSGYQGYMRLLFYLEELPTDNFIMPSQSNGLRKCLNITWGAGDASVVTWTYQRLYMAVAYSNEFLREFTQDKLEKRGLWGAFQNNYNEYRAQIKFIRAYAYMMLCNLYGNVPMIDENVGPKDLPAQWSREQIFDWTVGQIKDVIGEGGGSEQLAAPKGAVYGQVDRVAGWYLLARMYLNAKTWIGRDCYQLAYEYSKRIIDSRAYPLEKDYRHIFLADNMQSTEIIWPLINDGVHTHSSAGTNFYVKAFVNGPMDELYRTGVGSRGWGNVRAKTTLVKAFDPADVMFDVNDTWGNQKADKRAQFMTALPNQVMETWDENNNMTSTFTRGYGYIKWRNVTRTDQICESGEEYSSIKFPLFRSADAYMMAAEAILRGASAPRSEALGYVNEIRQRAYMSGPYAQPGIRSDVDGRISDADLTLDFILAERQREFASECMRRDDLVRFGLFTSGKNWDWKNADRLGSDVDSHFNLFPVPETEITNNPAIKQNPGY